MINKTLIHLNSAIATFIVIILFSIFSLKRNFLNISGIKKKNFLLIFRLVPRGGRGKKKRKINVWTTEKV